MSNFIGTFISERDEATLTKVLTMFTYNDEISVSIIQMRCHVGYHSANYAYNALIKQGKIIRNLSFPDRGKYITK